MNITTARKLGVAHAAHLIRVRIHVQGAVQGVGFRPFVYRLAEELSLGGSVSNSNAGALIEVEGDRSHLQTFLLRLECEQPPLCRIENLGIQWLPALGMTGFAIRASDHSGTPEATVLPDIATCPDCLHDLRNPANRRYRYPFTNCTNCGPRYSIMHRLPYDRPNTSMVGFAMCADCQREYGDPGDRRFHAQPIACPACGPQLSLWGSRGEVLAQRDSALLQAAAALREGSIAAVKGLGGFHLMVLASDDAAVRTLRERKHRDSKPLALMFPTLETIRNACEVSRAEEDLLRSPEAPIVLVQKKIGCPEISEQVSPGLDCHGVMLPYTPLHHLLMGEIGAPLVATSGNQSDEPICTGEQETVRRLSGIADLFLVHDRPIVRAVDDSVVRMNRDRPLMLRRSRGYAPLPIVLGEGGPEILAVGAHLKNTLALVKQRHVYLSQHIGDLETPQAYDAFTATAGALRELYAAVPAVVACDLHPDYLSTQYARSLGQNVLPVQHHYAHVLSVMAEHHLEGPVLGVAWDGSGYGTDDTVWGGEFLACTRSGYRRIAHLRPFRLPGANRAVREPRRSALGVLYALCESEFGAFEESAPFRAFSTEERETIGKMLRHGINSPNTTSAGRLFDAVASILGLQQRSGFEGQAAMLLEAAAARWKETAAPYPVPLAHYERSIALDWSPMISAILEDLQLGQVRELIAARFHTSLAEGIARVADEAGLGEIALSGGCFQNVLLSACSAAMLEARGFKVYFNEAVPPNDGGIALGQAAYAVWNQARTEPVSCV